MVTASIPVQFSHHRPPLMSDTHPAASTTTPRAVYAGERRTRPPRAQPQRCHSGLPRASSSTVAGAGQHRGQGGGRRARRRCGRWRAGGHGTRGHGVGRGRGVSASLCGIRFRFVSLGWVCVGCSLARKGGQLLEHASVPRVTERTLRPMSAQPARHACLIATAHVFTWRSGTRGLHQSNPFDQGTVPAQLAAERPQRACCLPQIYLCLLAHRLALTSAHRPCFILGVTVRSELTQRMSGICSAICRSASQPTRAKDGTLRLLPGPNATTTLRRTGAFKTPS